MAEIPFEGIETVMANLNKELSKISGRCEAGLVSAGLMIRGEAQRLTPVVTGNLRNSAYVVSAKQMHAGTTSMRAGAGETRSHLEKMVEEADRCKRAWTPTVSVGFTAEYAYSVHENPRAGKTGGISPSGRPYVAGKGSKRIVYSTVGQWKFLEAAIRNNIRRILDIIARKARR